MIVDCDRCAVRGDACADCVITVLLGAPPGGVRLDATERRAIDALADAGLIPQLRLVPAGPRSASNDTSEVAGWAEKRAERSTREAG
ncbi:MAG TPA: hypothetical protein VGJ95_03815 [Pseudonocardiaceae bacterium]|jgi:hypothetical protein